MIFKSVHNNVYLRVYLKMNQKKPSTIVHFKRLGSRVFHDSFNQYVFFFPKHWTCRKTNAIYT